VRASDELLVGISQERRTNEELIIKEARRRHRRRVLAIIGVVVLVVVGVLIALLSLKGHGSSPTHPSTAPTVRPDPVPTGTSVCQPGQIQVSSLGGGAGADNVDQVFGFVNISKGACTVSGYPRIAALNAQGDQVAVAAQQLSGLGGVQSGASAPPVVTLKPGQISSAMVSGTDIPIGNATTCPAGYPAFLITSPGSTQPVKISAVDGPGPGSFPGCSPIIRVNPIVPGTTGALAAPVVLPQGDRSGASVGAPGSTTIP
jgi:hypothetical protein